MDQAQFTLDLIQSNGFVFSNIQIIKDVFYFVLTIAILWTMMVKNINKRVESKVDKDVYTVKMESVDIEIKDLKQSDKDTRELFLGEIKELRKDLRLKVEKK